MSRGLMSEFRPTPVSGTTRIVVGIVLSVLITAATAVTVALVWLPRDIRYEISGESLRVMLRAGVWRVGREVRVASIAEARPIALRGGRRQFGTAMPGYCVGTFSYPDLGSAWQATSCGRAAILIRVAGEERPLLVNPADRDAFLGTLSTGRSGTFAPAPWAPLPGWIWVKLALLAPLLLVPLVPAYFFVAPRRLRYEIVQGELAVRLLLVTRRFPLAGSRVRAARPTKVRKVAGSAVPGYYAGVFRLDGESARVYASQVKEGVLVEGAKRVFVTPAEPEAFIAAVTRHGAYRV